MPVARRANAECGTLSRHQRVDGDQKAGVQLRAVDREGIDLADIRITHRPAPVGAGCPEIDGPVAKHTRLALDAREPAVALVDDKVVALASPPRHQDDPARCDERMQDSRF
jgi:hypothetical protein